MIYLCKFKVTEIYLFYKMAIMNYSKLHCNNELPQNIRYWSYLCDSIKKCLFRVFHSLHRTSRVFEFPFIYNKKLYENAL